MPCFAEVSDQCGCTFGQQVLCHVLQDANGIVCEAEMRKISSMTLSGQAWELELDRFRVLYCCLL